MKLVVAIIYHRSLMEPKNGAGSGFSNIHSLVEGSCIP
jgi:hypothetical protein